MGEILIKGLAIWVQKPQRNHNKEKKKSKYVADSDS